MRRPLPRLPVIQIVAGLVIAWLVIAWLVIAWLVIAVIGPTSDGDGATERWRGLITACMAVTIAPVR